jgi:methylmalonyl-CoA mutase N-terminal domain/subunit
MAGSYYVENLTDEIERRANDYLERIERIGGALKAVEAGFFAREIQESSWKFQRDVESRERVVVGVNEFVSPVGVSSRSPLLRVDPRVRDEQMTRLRALRARRDNVRVQNTLTALREAARGTSNLMPAILACVEADATLGEICDTLRKEFGEHRGGGMY